ncbi:hypothetical protein [Bacillus mesophilum]|uniref:Histidine kinase N-terminal 7TM region domain-containing protein n=1 Tax=Bacillus mesophilum TaxID=1071718 RepID=A0A7V7RJY9_9BACI|nr:hypothetical protein [Bacillus mesophilum]KAB2331391.1 hypothetical protein F7732_16230 [Bacillus mesophilum]
MDFVILSFSFIVSTIVSVLILKNTKSKWKSRLSAFIINTFILATSTWLLYITDEEAKMFGYVHVVLVVAIPIISWINFIILEVSKYKKWIA